MRYNPATDNAVENERIQAEMQFSHTPDMQAEVQPELSELDQAIMEITYNLWGAAFRIRRMGAGACTRDIHSMARDVQEVVQEFERLKARLDRD